MERFHLQWGPEIGLKVLESSGRRWWLYSVKMFCFFAAHLSFESVADTGTINWLINYLVKKYKQENKEAN